MDPIKLEADIIVGVNQRVKNDAPMLTERFGIVNDHLEHISRMGSKIVLQKSGLREETGFVKAVCDNDLMDAVLNSDPVMQTILSYVVLTFAINWEQFTKSTDI